MAFWGFDEWRRAPENCRQLCIYLHQADTIRQWLYYPSAAYTLSAQGMADLHAMCAMSDSTRHFHMAHIPIWTMARPGPFSQSAYLLELDSALASRQIPPPHVALQHDSAVACILPLAL